LKSHWKKHVIMDGLTKKDNVCVAVHDIDGDGRLDLALGAEWMPTNTQTGGSLQWLRQPEDPTKRWEMFPSLPNPLCIAFVGETWMEMERRN
jgi:hypothetical protein